MPSSISASLHGSGSLRVAQPLQGFLHGAGVLAGTFSSVGRLAGVGSVYAALGPVGRLSGKGSIHAAAWPASITLAGRGSVASMLAAHIEASLAGTGSISKSKLKGRAPLAIALSGHGSISHACLHGKWFAQGKGSLTATPRASGALVASLAGVGRVRGLLTGAWYARGHGSLTGSLSGRLRDAYVHQIVRRYRQGTFGGEIQGLETLTGNVELLIQQKFAGGSLNVPLGVSFHSANLVSVGILSDHAVTLYFNDPATGFLTVNAEQPIVWSTASPSAAPFTGNIDELYLTNAGTVPANFTLNLLLQE